jgi:hypothetical protein
MHCVITRRVLLIVAFAPAVYSVAGEISIVPVLVMVAPISLSIWPDAMLIVVWSPLRTLVVPLLLKVALMLAIPGTLTVLLFVNVAFTSTVPPKLTVPWF